MRSHGEEKPPRAAGALPGQAVDRARAGWEVGAATRATPCGETANGGRKEEEMTPEEAGWGREQRRSPLAAPECTVLDWPHALILSSWVTGA